MVKVQQIILISLYFLFIDAMWISFFAKGLYESHLMGMLKDDDSIAFVFALVAVYGLLLSGLFCFVLTKRRPVLLGALFGFIVYGVYGLTNWLVLSSWSNSMLFADWEVVAVCMPPCCATRGLSLRIKRRESMILKLVFINGVVRDIKSYVDKLNKMTKYYGRIESVQWSWRLSLDHHVSATAFTTEGHLRADVSGDV